MKLPKQRQARRPSIDAHEYDPKSGHLTVTFNGGRKYRYEGVDPNTASGLATAQSKGGFVNNHIFGKFKATKI